MAGREYGLFLNISLPKDFGASAKKWYLACGHLFTNGWVFYSTSSMHHLQSSGLRKTI
jgi:hypothetical protein